MLADHAEKIGIEFPAFGTTLAAALEGLLPDIATVSNPLDYTTPIWGQPEYTLPVFTAAVSPEYTNAAVLVQDYPAAGLDESQTFYRNDALAFAGATTAKGIPAAICSTLPENMDEVTRKLFIQKGIAPMQGIHECLNAISHSISWSEAREYILTNPPLPLYTTQINLTALAAMDELSGKKWLKNN